MEKWLELKTKVKELIKKDKKEPFDRTLNGMIAIEFLKELNRIKETYVDNNTKNGIFKKSVGDIIGYEDAGINIYKQIERKLNYIYSAYFLTFPAKNMVEYFNERIKLKDPSFDIKFFKDEIDNFEIDNSNDIFDSFSILLKKKKEILKEQFVKLKEKTIKMKEPKTFVKELEKIYLTYKNNGNDNCKEYFNIKYNIYYKWRILAELMLRKGKIKSLNYNSNRNELEKIYQTMGIKNIPETELHNCQDKFNMEAGILNLESYEKVMFDIEKKIER
jgi:hypothetical protein